MSPPRQASARLRRAQACLRGAPCRLSVFPRPPIHAKGDPIMWSIDRIEGDFALCENTVTGETCRIPLAELPQGIGEGALLHHTPAGWQRAEEAERARRRQMAAKIRNLFGPSPFEK